MIDSICIDISLVLAAHDMQTALHALQHTARRDRTAAKTLSCEKAGTLTKSGSLKPQATETRKCQLELLLAQVTKAWPVSMLVFFFFFNNPAPTEISPFPLHDAFPI